MTVLFVLLFWYLQYLSSLYLHVFRKILPTKHKWGRAILTDVHRFLSHLLDCG